MEPIYDRGGSVVGWIHEGRILDTSNEYRGFLRGDSVYSMEGSYLGRYRQGFFRDQSGDAVAFTPGASGGPLQPLRRLAPLAPLVPLAPLNPLPPIAPLAPIDTLRWGITWDEFLEG